MEVRLMLTCFVEDVLCDDMYKVVEMSALPPVGTDFYLSDIDDWSWGSEPIKVKKVEWWEGCTHKFLVVLEDFVLSADQEWEDNKSVLESMGWEDS